MNHFQHVPSRLLSLFFVALVFAGAGCFNKGAVDPNTDGGVWRSMDGGATWTQQPAVQTGEGLASSSGTSVLTLSTDPSDPQAIYAGTEQDGILFSYDGTASWMRSGDPAVRAGAITAVAVDPRNTCRVYVAKGDRILRSEDCNRHYDAEVYVIGRAGTSVTDLEVDWFNTDVIYAGLSDGTLLKSSDRGANWTSVYRGAKAITDILVSHADSRVVMATMMGAGIARTEDGGETWDSILVELRPYRDAGRALKLAQDAQGKTFYLMNYYGLFRSEDQGLTWTPLNLLTAPNQVLPSAVAVDPMDGNHLVYGVGNAFYQSADGGVNWSVLKLPTTRQISTIMFHRTSSETLYLGLRKIEQ